MKIFSFFCGFIFGIFWFSNSIMYPEKIIINSIILIFGLTFLYIIFNKKR